MLLRCWKGTSLGIECLDEARCLGKAHRLGAYQEVNAKALPRARPTKFNILTETMAIHRDHLKYLAQGRHDSSNII
jgi:hypothetical protein